MPESPGQPSPSPANPRRQRIETMLAEDPGDVFLRYSLALAMDSDGNGSPAWRSSKTSHAAARPTFLRFR
jgi:hypothetical protein